MEKYDFSKFLRHYIPVVTFQYDMEDSDEFEDTINSIFKDIVINLNKHVQENKFPENFFDYCVLYDEVDGETDILSVYMNYDPNYDVKTLGSINENMIRKHVEIEIEKSKIFE